MDRKAAKKLAGTLRGNTVGTWVVGDYINSGFSAVVVEARRGDEETALKVFDPQLVERSGEEEQLERIRREVEVSRFPHPNLVRILGGGKCERTGCLYVAMERLRQQPLSSYIGRVPADKIATIISQIASAAKHLEDHAVVHRDIKPANVVVNNTFEEVVLLDLGVLRPLRGSELTDHSGKEAIGTVKYCPCEYLYRREDNSPDGWRAITFYQLGAVLHDLITGVTLFKDREHPIAALYEAVRDVMPEIPEKEGVAPGLVALARDCLLKRPEQRLALVTWERFSTAPLDARQAEADRSRIVQLQSLEPGTIPGNAEARLLQLRAYASDVAECARSVCFSDPVFPPVELSDFSDDEAVTVALAFKPSVRLRLVAPLFVYIKICFHVRGEEPLRIQVASVLSAGPSQQAPGDWDDMYVGSFESSAIRERLRGILLRTLRWAIESNDQVVKESGELRSPE